MTRKVLIPDAVAPVCDRVFVDAGYQVNRMITPTPNEIAASIADYDAIVVRSAVEVTAELIARGTRLRAIGRAGAGVDNIDVDAATTAGVTVINTPGGNTVSAAEHTIALLMALLRKIPAADHSMKQGAWNRSSFKGNEICGKRIGIVGLGRIGRAVAVRLGAFEAEIITGTKALALDTLGIPNTAEQAA